MSLTGKKSWKRWESIVFFSSSSFKQNWLCEIRERVYSWWVWWGFFFVFQTKSFCSFTTDQKVLSCHFLQGFNPNSNTTCERTVNKSKHTAVTWSLKRCSNNKDDETPWSTQHFCPPGAGGNTVVCFETKPKHVMRFCNTCYVFIALPVLSIVISLEENAQRNLDVYLQPGFWELLTVTDSYSA